MKRPLVLAAAAMAFGHPVAWAAPDATSAPADLAEEARALSDEGLAHFKRGEYERAISAFERSFAIRPAPALLFDLGQAYRRKGECAKSADMFRRFVATDPAARRASVDARIVEMDSCAKAKAASESKPSDGGDAEAMVATSTTPAPKPLPLATTTYPASKPIAPQPSPLYGPMLRNLTPEPAADTGKKARLIGLAIAGTGLLGLAAAAYISTQVVAERNRVSALFRAGGTWDPSWDAVLARGQRDERLSSVLYAGGGVALGTGLAVYYLLGRQSPKPSHVASYIVPLSDGIAWRRAF